MHIKISRSYFRIEVKSLQCVDCVWVLCHIVLGDLQYTISKRRRMYNRFEVGIV